MSSRIFYNRMMIIRVIGHQLQANRAYKALKRSIKNKCFHSTSLHGGDNSVAFTDKAGSPLHVAWIRFEKRHKGFIHDVQEYASVDGTPMIRVIISWN